MARSTTSKSIKRYRTLLLVIIESGLIVTITKAFEYGLYQNAPGDGLDGLNAMYIPFDCMPQITVCADITSNLLSDLISSFLGYRPNIDRYRC